MPTDPCPSQECALTRILTSTACLALLVLFLLVAMVVEVVVVVIKIRLVAFCVNIVGIMY